MSRTVAIGKEDEPFVGRENEQEEYWDFLAGKSDDPWLLVISGLGGIGKSTLLNKLYKQTLEQHALPGTFAILLNFDVGINTELSLQTDSTQLGSLLQTSSPQPDALLRTDPLLFLNELAHRLKLHCDPEQFDAFTEALQKGRTQLAQFKEQVEQTSQSFAREHGMQPPSDARQKIRFAELEINRQVRELVTEAFYRQVDTFQPERLVIMLDTCELLNESESWIFSQWLMNEFLPELHSRMWRKPCFVVMASRIPPESEVIDEYDQQHLVLSMLEESAVDAYLEKMGMRDPALCHSVYNITRGHALCVAIIGQFYQNIGQEALQTIDTSVLQTAFDQNASLELINERILNRLDDPFKDLTQYGVLLRTFTLPLLRTVFSELLPEEDAKAIFDQFIRYPYIESRGNYRYAFHELIREVLAKNTQKKDPGRWRQYHKKALDYFSMREASPHSLDWYYHNLAYEEAQGMSDWRKAIQEARDRGDTQRVNSLLQITDDVALNLTTLSRAECAYEWGRLSVDRRQPLDKALEKYEEALRLYGQVGDHPEEVRQGQANVLQAMGDVQQSKVQLDKALTSYQDALDLLQHCEKRPIEVEAQVLKKVGDVQQLRGNLDDLNAALENYKQVLNLFRQIGNTLQVVQELKDMGDVQQQRYQLLGDPDDLNVALENYEQALGLFQQVKNRSKEDEAKILEAMGDVHQLRYQLSANQHDLEAATESYQLAFGLFSDDTNARKRVKEKVEAQKQKNKPAGQLAYQQQIGTYALPPSPPRQIGTYALSPSPPLPKRGFSRSSARIILLIGLAFLIVGGSISFLVTNAVSHALYEQANATATAQAPVNATAQAEATVIATANPNPYTTNDGTLVLLDPLHDNSKGYTWQEEVFPHDSCGFVGGTYQVSETRPGYFDVCPAESTSFSNFTYEVKMTIVQGDAGGISFRVQQLNLYSFVIGQDGAYALTLYVGNRGDRALTLVSGVSPAINTGLKQSNLLAVVAQDSLLELYVNGQPLAAVNDTTYSQGQIGVIASAQKGPTRVIFANVKVWVP